MYPTLQLLENAGFVSATRPDTKRVYSITEAGTAELQTKVSEAGGPPPWMDSESAGSYDDLRKSIRQLIVATKQISMSDNQAHVDATATNSRTAHEVHAPARSSGSVDFADAVVAGVGAVEVAGSVYADPRGRRNWAVAPAPSR